MRGFLVVLMAAVLTAAAWGVAVAGHNGAEVTFQTGECGETVFTAGIKDPEENHIVTNMDLVVFDGTEVSTIQSIPTDGTTAQLTVGPFATDTLIQWRVFGGADRVYDDPLWNGFAPSGPEGAAFSAAVAAYGAENGFGFINAGPDDPNPFTTWYEFLVEGCPATIIVEKQANGAGSIDFPFSGDLGEFDVEDGEEQVFGNLAAGSYLIREGPLGGWDLTEIDCGEANVTDTDVADRDIRVHVEMNETVRCIFVNERELTPTATATDEATATPTATATATPTLEPQRSTGNVGGIFGPLPQRSPTPQPQAAPEQTGGTIVPPSTGSGGLR